MFRLTMRSLSVQGISADLDDGFDAVTTAEEARRQRQRELEIEAEMRVSIRIRHVCTGNVTLRSNQHVAA